MPSSLSLLDSMIARMPEGAEKDYLLLAGEHLRQSLAAYFANPDRLQPRGAIESVCLQSLRSEDQPCFLSNPEKADKP